MMDLERLKALADAATPGPWEADGYNVCALDYGVMFLVRTIGSDRGTENDCADAAFIAAAREAMPALVTEVERLRADNARLNRLADRAEAVKAAVGEVLSVNGCECDCGCHIDEHDDDCERCLGCRVEMAMRSAASGTVIVEDDE